MVELGWTCKGGTATTPDVCTETCGDGRNYRSYANACDDGNTVDGDGCSSSCTVETGWTCTGGNMARPDVCIVDVTACAATKDYGFKSCVDNNPTNLDGCNSACETERGWECLRGTPTVSDTCFEVCGDSWNMNQLPCDDGNVNYMGLGNDGCAWATPNKN
jgi:cysteine-rich repeat protein